MGRIEGVGGALRALQLVPADGAALVWASNAALRVRMSRCVLEPSTLRSHCSHVCASDLMSLSAKMDSHAVRFVLPGQLCVCRFLLGLYVVFAVCARGA